MPKIIEGAYVPTPKNEQEDAAEEKKFFQSTKELLDAQPKVEITIPLDRIDTHNTVLVFIMNGYPYTILRGTPVSVPESVAEEMRRKGLLV